MKTLLKRWKPVLCRCPRADKAAPVLLVCLFMACGPLQAEEISVDPIDTLLSEVGPACLKATDPKDLYPLAEKIEKARNAILPSDRANELDVATALISEWQRYLTARNSENQAAAKNVLEGLINNRECLPLLPRSEVIALLAAKQLQPVPPIHADAWEDLPLAIEILRKVQDPNNPDINPDDLIALQNLQTLGKALEEKNWDAVVEGCVLDSKDALCVRRFKQLLLVKVVPAYLRLDPKYQLPVEKGQFPGPYLAKLESMARQDQDWISLWRILSFEREKDYGKSPFQLMELKGLDLYLSAPAVAVSDKPEKAGVRYRSALLLPLPPALVEAITQGIQSYQRDHPEPWKKALGQSTIAPSLERSATLAANLPDEAAPKPKGRKDLLWERY